MATRNGRLRGLAAAVALALGFGQAAGAAVLCQKGKKIKLRADACRANETPATLGGGDDPAGIWKFSAGNMFDYTELRAEFLVLSPDGSGRLNLSGGDGPVLTCLPLNHSPDANRKLVVDDMGFVFGTRVLGFELEGDSRLELVDAGGLTASFDRATAVDADKECGSLVTSARFPGLPRLGWGTGLAFDGSELWYLQADAESILPVDPAAGSPGSPLAFDRLLHAAQGADFWTLYGQRGGVDVTRYNRPGQKVDEVQTGPELGEEVYVNALAFDSAAGVLWLHGKNDAEQGRLLKVEADGEPDVLLAAYDLDAAVSGMAVVANALWAVDEDSQSLMRIDPATGKVTGTFLIPDRSAYWQGVAGVSNQLFLLGGTDFQAVLLVVETP